MLKVKTWHLLKKRETVFWLFTYNYGIIPEIMFHILHLAIYYTDPQFTWNGI